MSAQVTLQARFRHQPFVKATDQGRAEVLDTARFLQSNTSMATKLTPMSASSKPKTIRSACEPFSTQLSA
jgi:hypothetical protein